MEVSNNYQNSCHGSLPHDVIISITGDVSMEYHSGTNTGVDNVTMVTAHDESSASVKHGTNSEVTEFYKFCSNHGKNNNALRESAVSVKSPLGTIPDHFLPERLPYMDTDCSQNVPVAVDPQSPRFIKTSPVSFSLVSVAKDPVGSGTTELSNEQVVGNKREQELVEQDETNDRLMIDRFGQVLKTEGACQSPHDVGSKSPHDRIGYQSHPNRGYQSPHNRRFQCPHDQGGYQSPHDQQHQSLHDPRGYQPPDDRGYQPPHDQAKLRRVFEPGVEATTFATKVDIDATTITDPQARSYSRSSGSGSTEVSTPKPPPNYLAYNSINSATHLLPSEEVEHYFTNLDNRRNADGAGDTLTNCFKALKSESPNDVTPLTSLNRATMEQQLAPVDAHNTPVDLGYQYAQSGAYYQYGHGMQFYNVTDPGISTCDQSYTSSGSYRGQIQNYIGNNYATLTPRTDYQQSSLLNALRRPYGGLTALNSGGSLATQSIKDNTRDISSAPFPPRVKSSPNKPSVQTTSSSSSAIQLMTSQYGEYSSGQSSNCDSGSGSVSVKTETVRRRRSVIAQGSQADVDGSAAYYNAQQPPSYGVTSDGLTACIGWDSSMATIMNLYRHPDDRGSDGMLIII